MKAACLEEMVSLCGVRVGEQVYGIETHEVWEVLGEQQVERVPMAPGYLGGVMAYRGEVVTVVSFRWLLGLVDERIGGCVLVLNGEAERFGLMVDEVMSVVVLEGRMLTGNPATLDEVGRMLYSGAYQREEGLMVRLEARRLEPRRLAETGMFAMKDRGGGR